ncbi:MAG: acyltransferase [Actinomycetota bacterium]|nr:acyltransferase [Actinomycetota bacterium]
MTMAAARARDKEQTEARGRLRLDIQGLRAVAVLLVVADHVFRNPSGGFVGVDVFFVISGYLITGLLLREREKTERTSIREFYARRARRILPIAVLVLVVTNLVARRVFSPARIHQTLNDSVWSLLFGANIHFSRLGTDYFQQNRPPSAVQHYWSLSVEEQFYIVWPTLLIVGFLLARRLRRRPRAVVIGLAGLATAASFAWALHLTATNHVAAYFSTPARAWELGLGALLAAAASRLDALPAAARAAGSWLGLIAIGYSAFAYDDRTLFPGSAALLPVLGAGLILASNDPIGGAGRFGVLDNPVSQYVGKISYSLYLWHFPCIVLATGYFTHKSVGYYAVAALLPFLLSAWSFHVVEDPIRHSRWLSARTAREKRKGRRSLGEWGQDNERTLNALLASFAVIVVLGAFAVLNAKRQADVGGLYALPGSIDTSSSKSLSTDVSPVAAALATATWGNLRPSPDDLPASIAPQWKPDGCLDVLTDADAAKCVYGNKSGAISVVVVGDSIAASWMPAIVGAFPDAQIHMLTRGECPLVDTPTYRNSNSVGIPFQQCLDHRKFVLAKLATIRPDLVIDSNRSWQFARQLVPDPGSDAAALVIWREATQRELVAMKTFAKRVVLLGSPPGGANLQICYTKQSHPRDCVMSLRDRVSAMADIEAQAAHAVGAGVTFVDPRPWFCYGGECPGAIAGTVVYWDDAHLTRQFSESLVPQLKAALAVS